LRWDNRAGDDHGQRPHHQQVRPHVRRPAGREQPADQGHHSVSKSLFEKPTRRSEPDVVLDFSDGGVVVIEAKLFSPNERKPESYAGWSKYLDHSAFRDPESARATGFYQLVRNWRIGTELAGKRPFTLVNLAPEFVGDERAGLARLRLALRTSRERRFVLRRWNALLSGLVVPDWFSDYARRRGLPVTPSYPAF